MSSISKIEDFIEYKQANPMLWTYYRQYMRTNNIKKKIKIYNKIMDVFNQIKYSK